MKEMTLVLAAVAILFGPVSVNAQLWDAAPVGEELGSVRVYVGSLQPSTDYNDGSSLTGGTAVGLSAIFWAHRNLGLQASILRGKNGVDFNGEFSALVGQDPTIMMYSLEAVIRYPMVAGSLEWFPYLAGGPLLKNYSWAIHTPLQGGRFDRPYGGHRNSSSGWGVGGGVEIRVGGAFGVAADVRQISSQFDWFGLRADQSDLLLSVGITANR